MENELEEDAAVKPLKVVHAKVMGEADYQALVARADRAEKRAAELEQVIHGMFPLWIAAMSFGEHGRAASLDRIRNYYNGRDNPLTNEELHFLFSLIPEKTKK